MKPVKTDFDEYFHYYVDLVKVVNLMEAFTMTQAKTQEFLSSISEEMGDHRYQPNKWSIKEILCHLIDTERIFSYRALRFSRNDATELPGYDHDAYVRHANTSERKLEDLSSEFNAVRNATVALFSGISDSALANSGLANGKRLTVLSIGFLSVGHEIHHLNVIKDKYIAKG